MPVVGKGGEISWTFRTATFLDVMGKVKFSAHGVKSPHLAASCY